MAKGKSNPKTVARVKGMTKAMRNEMERAEAEAAATEAAARSAKERRRGRRKQRDASSEEDDEDAGGNADDATSTTTHHKPSKGNRSVQIGGFGIGCRGTGNEKARRLKEEHDEKTKKKKAARARLAAERAGRDRDGAVTPANDRGSIGDALSDDESWRVRNPTVNKRANRGKKKRKDDAFSDDDDDEKALDDESAHRDDDAAALEDDETTSDCLPVDASEGTDAPFSGGALRGAARAAAASAFALLRGDDDEEDDDEDDAEEEDEDGDEKKTTVSTKPADDLDELADDGSDDRAVIRDVSADDANVGEPRPAEPTDGMCGQTVAPAREDPDDADDDSASAEALSEALASSSSDWETDEEKDADASARPNPFASLFDAHESETVIENLEYMRRAHGFVVPYADSLADPEGFVNYLRRKIVRRRQCAFCHRRFATLEGVRGHMRDAGHVRVRFEPPAVFRGNPLFDEAVARANADGYQPEYAEFYDFGDFGGTSGSDAGVTPHGAGTEIFDARRVGGGLELVLRDETGRTKQLGHRSFRRYYKQKFRNDYVARGSKADERRVAAAAPAAKLAERERNKQTNAIATRSMRVALRGASKALAAQFTTKAGFADNAARRAIVHHWGAGGGGSHYHTAGSKQFLKGVRIKGVVSRHSKQGAKMQAARVQAARNKQNRGNASVAVLRSGTRKG